MKINKINQTFLSSQSKSKVFAAVFVVSSLVTNLTHADDNQQSVNCIELNQSEKESKFLDSAKAISKYRKLQQNPTLAYLSNDISETNSWLMNINYKLSNGIDYDMETLSHITRLVEYYTDIILLNEPKNPNTDELFARILGKTPSEQQIIMNQALQQKKHSENTYGLIKSRLTTVQQTYLMIGQKIKSNNNLCLSSIRQSTTIGGARNSQNSASSTSDNTSIQETDEGNEADVLLPNKAEKRYSIRIRRNHSLSGELANYIPKRNIRRYLQENKAEILSTNNIKSLDKVEVGIFHLPNIQNYR